MFISKKHVPRRTFLRGAGVTMALPLLDAMVPAATALAQTAATPKPRFFGGFVCHGGAPGYWIPKTDNLMDGELPYIYKPLEPYKNQTVIFSGLHSRSAEPPPGATGADHWVAAAFLCANKPKKTAGADVSVFSPTIDQVIAQKIGQETLLPSLQMNVEDPGPASSNCGEGYSCVYTNSLSWVSATQPLPMELNPQVVFERMFGDGSTAEQRAARRSRDRSILDSLSDSLGRLRVKLSAADQRRVDQYAADIREIERRLQIAMQASNVAPAEMAVPVGVPPTFDEHIKLMFDLLALSWRGDMTRVATLNFARDLTGRTYPESEAPTQGFHGTSHHGEDPRRILNHAQINQYHVKMLAYFVDKLAKAEDGDGTLLDHSLVLYGTNMGNSNQHLHHDVPHVIIGGLNGKVKGGRHLAYPSKTVPTGNLLLSVLDLYDIHQESQGDSTGRLEAL
jgi:ribosomal protein S10